MKCAQCGVTARQMSLWIQMAGMTGKTYFCCWRDMWSDPEVLAR